MANRIVLNQVSYHGAGAIAEIPAIVKGQGCKKVFVASDPGLIQFGVTGKVTDLLDQAKIKYKVFSDIKPNPTIENVQAGVKAFQAAKADCIVAIGGGSSIDTAKAIGVIVTNPKFANVRSLEGVAPTKNPCVFTIAVPTTAGTAAEVTINYVITDREKDRKFVCVDPHDIPMVAVVDPDMMLSMPAKLCAATGMDALTHAIEGYITKGAWEMTDMFHLKAIELIGQYLRKSVKGDKEAREKMGLAQYIAGMGFSNVGLGIAHAMAHPLSAYYDTPHGVACAILLPHVMKFNSTVKGSDARYRAIAVAMGVPGAEKLKGAAAIKAACDAVAKLGTDVGIPPDLKEIVKAEDIAFLAKSAFMDACRPGNPRDVTEKELADLYTALSAKPAAKKAPAKVAAKPAAKKPAAKPAKKAPAKKPAVKKAPAKKPVAKKAPAKKAPAKKK